MANVSDVKTIYAPMEGEPKQVDVIYNFAVDAGATGDLVMLNFGENVLVHSACLVFETAATSGGSATIALKMGSSVISSTLAVASAVAGAVIKPALALSEGTPNTGNPYFPLVCGTSDALKFTIATATLTAGKAHLKVVYSKAY